MSLVSYDYSGSEDEEDTDVNETEIVKKDVSNSNNYDHNTKVNTDIVEPSNSLFSKLPETKDSNSSNIQEDEIEDFIPKSKPVKVKEKVKITIPSLSEFSNLEEEDEHKEKKFKPSPKGSGLLGMLPPVKGAPLTATSFVPKVIADKTKKPATNLRLVPDSVKKSAEAKKKLMLKKIEKRANTASDTESEDEIEMPETFDDEMWEKVCGRPKPKKIIEESTVAVQEESINIAPEPEKPYDGLDNQAFKELVGRTKRPIGNIKLIDINEEEIVADKDVWMTKSLTDPEMAPKQEVEEPVDPTRRRKHHITYLAEKAKAQEQELKSAWAASKNNRLMSRAKYGF